MLIYTTSIAHFFEAYIQDSNSVLSRMLNCLPKSALKCVLSSKQKSCDDNFFWVTKLKNNPQQVSLSLTLSPSPKTHQHRYSSNAASYTYLSF